MKILNQGGGGGGSSGGSDGIDAGDIILSSTRKDTDYTSTPPKPSDKWVLMSGQSYLGDTTKNDIKNKTFTGLPSGSFIAYNEYNIGNYLKNERIWDLTDSILFCGWNDSNNTFIVGKNNHTTNQLIELQHDRPSQLRAVYDYKNTLYIYEESSVGTTDMITSCIKLDVDTLSYETFDFTNPKRILKAFYDKAEDKYITNECNLIDENDPSLINAGIFVSSDFMDMGAPEFNPLVISPAFENLTFMDMMEKIRNQVIYTKDKHFLVVDSIANQLLKYDSAGVGVVLIDIKSKELDKENIKGYNFIIEQYGCYFVCFNNFSSDGDYEFISYAYYKKDNAEIGYCFVEALLASNKNFGVVLDKVFNYSPNTYYFAVLYQTLPANQRQCKTFNTHRIYANCNPVNDGDLGMFRKDYFININYNEIFNDNKMYVLNDFGSMTNSYGFSGPISTMFFDGRSLGKYVYVSKMASPNQTMNYYLKVKK